MTEAEESPRFSKVDTRRPRRRPGSRAYVARVLFHREYVCDLRRFLESFGAAWRSCFDRELNERPCGLGLSLRMDVNLKREKGIWWMPWHREAMKDVIGCEKLRGAANRL